MYIFYSYGPSRFVHMQFKSLIRYSINENNYLDRISFHQNSSKNMVSIENKHQVLVLTQQSIHFIVLAISLIHFLSTNSFFKAFLLSHTYSFDAYLCISLSYIIIIVYDLHESQLRRWNLGHDSRIHNSIGLPSLRWLSQLLFWTHTNKSYLFE